MRRHPLDRRPVEEVDVGDEVATDTPGALADVQLQVEPDRLDLARKRPDLQTGESTGLRGCVAHDEHDLTQRVATEVALRLELIDESLERELLVFVRR